MAEEKKGRTVYKSQFSMGLLDFERYDKLLKEADLHGVKLWTGDVNAIIPYFSALKQFYLQIRFIVVDKRGAEDLKFRIERYIANIEQLQARGGKTEYLIPRLKKDMEEFATMVYEIKQLVGLGIDVEKVMSAKKRWEASARLSHD